MNDAPAPALESLFLRFRERGDARALATVFDHTAPELGRVATYLSGGDHARAEDLLQQTWLTAMTHAQRWDRERPLLPWLLGMLANHARSQQRAQRRHTPGEAALGALLASDDPVRASEDGEFQRLLAVALAELESPFREAVTLHVQHGLTAVEIGEALGRPAGTVRTQIVRGLDRLRARLPVGLATAGVYLPAFTSAQLQQVKARVLAQLPAPAAPSGVPAGVVRGTGLVAALTVVTAMLVLWRPAETLPPANAASAPAPEVVAAASEAPASERLSVALQPQEPAPVAAPKERPRRITVHVRHADEPTVQAGEWVALVERGELRLLRTDERGDVVFEQVAEELTHQVFVSGTEVRDTWFVPRDPGHFTHEITLAVPAVAALAVTVVDADGRPVADAEVEGNGSQFAQRTWCPLGRTGADGVLRRRGQVERGAQLRARAAGHAPSPWTPSTVGRDRTQSCQLVLGRPGQPLLGRVVDERGAPLAAELGTIAFADDLVEPWFDQTAADGTFALDWLPLGHVAIVARARRGGSTLLGMVRTDVPSHGPIEVRVANGGTLQGTTKFADGGPGGDATLSLRLLADGAFALPFAQRTLRAAGAGEFVVPDLLPGRWLARATIGDAEVQQIVEIGAGQVATWHAVGKPVASLRVHVRDEHGESLADWRVQPMDTRGHPLGMPGLTMGDGITMESTTWKFPTDAPLTLALFDPAAYAWSPDFPVHRVPGVVADGSVLTVTVPDRARATHRVRGLVVDENGQPLAATVMATSAEVWWTGPTVATDAHGAFALGPFAPGRVTLTVSAAGLPDLRLPEVTIPVDGDLDLGSLALARAGTVRLVAAAGIDVPDDLRLELVAESGERHALPRDDAGGFVPESLPCGRYQLRGSSGTQRVLPLAVVVTPAANATPIKFRLEPAPPLRILVELGEEARAQMGWSSTLVVRARGGEVVVRRRLNQLFHGRVEPLLAFVVAVPVGDYTVELDDHWSLRRATAAVGDGGGVVTFAR